MKTYEWYQNLIRPFFAPPAWIFGPVWTVLYAIIAVSYGAVFYKAFTRQIPWMVALPFALNLIFNLLYTPIMFGLKNIPLASLDILLVLGTLVWALLAIYPHVKWVALINVPYFAWVSFATVLQLSIFFLNR
jgi:tryptophan-rich sensory protein